MAGVGGDPISVVPADEAGWAAVAAVLESCADSRRCWCQRYKLARGESLQGFPADERGQSVEGRADPDVHYVCEAGGSNVRLRHGGVPGGKFAGGDVSVVGQSAGQPEGAETGQRANLQHPLGALDANQQHEQFPGRRCNLNVRHRCVVDAAQYSVHAGSALDQGGRQVVLNLGPAGLAAMLNHGPSLALIRRSQE